jgi:hypothetical protein
MMTVDVFKIEKRLYITFSRMPSLNVAGHTLPKGTSDGYTGRIKYIVYNLSISLDANECIGLCIHTFCYFDSKSDLHYLYFKQNVLICLVYLQLNLPRLIEQHCVSQFYARFPLTVHRYIFIH